MQDTLLNFRKLALLFLFFCSASRHYTYKPPISLKMLPSQYFRCKIHDVSIIVTSAFAAIKATGHISIPTHKFSDEL